MYEAVFVCVWQVHQSQRAGEMRLMKSQPDQTEGAGRKEGDCHWEFTWTPHPPASPDPLPPTASVYLPSEPPCHHTAQVCRLIMMDRH